MGEPPNPFKSGLFLRHWVILPRAGGAPLSGLVYRFGDFWLDCGAFQLLRDGQSLRVERKPMNCSSSSPRGKASSSLAAQLGDKERTLALLEEGYQQHSTDTLWIQGDPAYDFLHSDRRFRSIVQRTGVAPAY